jgi:hypothetical protein
MLDESLYEKLLGDRLPIVIRNMKEYRRLLGAAKRLMEMPDEKRLRRAGCLSCPAS